MLPEIRTKVETRTIDHRENITFPGANEAWMGGEDPGQCGQEGQKQVGVEGCGQGQTFDSYGPGRL